MSSNRFFNGATKTETPIINRHTRKEESRKEKFKQTSRSLSVDSFFTKAPEEPPYNLDNSKHEIPEKRF